MNNNYWNYLEHSAKGSTWKKHKYIKKEGDKYVYKNTNFSGGSSKIDKKKWDPEYGRYSKEWFQEFEKKYKDVKDPLDRTYDLIKESIKENRNYSDSLSNKRKRDVKKNNDRINNNKSELEKSRVQTGLKRSEDRLRNEQNARNIREREAVISGLNRSAENILRNRNIKNQKNNLNDIRTLTSNKNNLKELRSNIEKRNGEKYLKNLNSRYKMAERLNELRASKNKSFYKKAVITGRAMLNRALMAGGKSRDSALKLINKAKGALIKKNKK